MAIKALGLVLRLLASVKGDRVTSNSLRLLLGAGNDSSSNLWTADPAGLDEQLMGEGMLMVSAVRPWKEPGFQAMVWFLLFSLLTATVCARRCFLFCCTFVSGWRSCSHPGT